MKTPENDFQNIILFQKEQSKKTSWSGSVLDYLYLVKENPKIAQFAPERLYNALIKKGVTQVPDEEKIHGYSDLVRYNFFDKEIYGTLEPIHDIMRFLKAASGRTETGKRILILVGPVSSGKSTIAYLLKRCIEQDDTPIYAIDGCPINEEPLHAIPLVNRQEWEEHLGAKIEGTLCPACQLNLEQNYDGNWERLPVKSIELSEQKRIGIGTFQPSDPKSQDVSELIGSINMSKLTMYGDSDPRAYQFNGELQIANRGMIDMIEMLKTDVKLLYVLITAAQEKLIKSPNFPQMYVDVFILAHTNQTEFDSFKADQKNEALHDRMYPIYVPWNVKVDDEVNIYRKLIRQSKFKDIHIAPNTLEIAAKFAILTRLVKSERVSSLLEKMRLYNGEAPEGFKKEDIDIKALRFEGREKGEGMFGVSPRFIINALNTTLASKKDKNCINPVDVIRALVKNFDHHIGYSPEMKENFLLLLKGEKDSVLSEFRTIAKKEVSKAFLSAYEDQAQNLFDNYIRNAGAYCRKEKVKDAITEEVSSPDEKLMRTIEETIGVPQNSAKEFRQAIFVQKSGALERGEAFNYASYAPLREAIEIKLMADLKNVVSLSIADPTKSYDKKVVKKREEALERLMESGYCEHCARILLAYVGDILRKEG